MAAFHRARDEQSGPIYGLTCDFAKLEPPPPQMLHLFGAIKGNSDAMDDFVSVMAGALPAPEFFRPRKRHAHHGWRLATCWSRLGAGCSARYSVFVQRPVSATLPRSSPETCSGRGGSGLSR